MPNPSRSRTWAALAVAVLVAGGAYWMINRGTDGADQRPSSAVSIAVLPFSDLSEEQNQSALCDGLSEQITDELTRVAGVRVAGRASAIRVQKAGGDLQEIGRKLNVQLLLQGSVRTAGERVRVTAQLVDAATGFHSWSANFDGARDDLFGLEDQIARAVAQRLALQLARPNEPEAARSSPRRKRSHELFLQARDVHRKMNPATIRDALRLHEQSAQADPTYPLAHSGLSHVITSAISIRAVDAERYGPVALAEAKKALSLDPRLADAHSALIRVHRDVTHDWDAADTACREAIAASPNQSGILSNCATLDSLLGRHTQAIERHRRAVELDPLWEGAREALATALHRSGKTEEALAEATAIRQSRPDFLSIYPRLALIYADRGAVEQAIATLDDAKARLGRETPELAAIRVYAQGFNGRMAEARSAAEQLRNIAGRNDHLELALGSLALGEISRAADHVEEAAKQRSPNLPDFLAEPFVHRLAQHPRFQEIRHQMRLD